MWQKKAFSGFIQRRGVRLIKDVREGRGSKEKQKIADKGGEGVKNPGNFADVLYEWSLRKFDGSPGIAFIVQNDNQVTDITKEIH